MKLIQFLGNSRQCLCAFPKGARQDAGYQLELVQRGEQPGDFRPMPTIGRGVEELRIRDESGAYRVVYVSRYSDAVYVLHAFQKKTQATSKKDIDLARQRFLQIERKRK